MLIGLSCAHPSGDRVLPSRCALVSTHFSPGSRRLCRFRLVWAAVAIAAVGIAAAGLFGAYADTLQHGLSVVAGAH